MTRDGGPSRGEQEPVQGLHVGGERGRRERDERRDVGNRRHDPYNSVPATMHVYKITDSHTHTRLIARFDIQDISRYGNRDSMISRTWPEEKGLNSFTQTTAHFVLQLVTGSSVT